MTEASLVSQEAIERRRFLKGAAVVAWATPAILTLTANRAGAVSCIPHNVLCDACTGVNCCIQGSDAVPCCCSDPDDFTTCDGVCKTTAECQAIFPGGPSNDPDACFYPGGTGSSSAAVGTLSTSGKSKL
jgi:hypothetical protein